MKNSQYLDLTRLDAIRGDKGGANNHQFSGPFDTTCPTALTMLNQTRYLLFNFITLSNGSHRIIISNKVNYRVEITLGGGQPFDNQEGATFAARTCKAFFFSAQRDWTVS